MTAAAAEGMAVARDRVAREFERLALVRALRQSRGNISQAARLAGTTRRRLDRLLIRYSIDAAVSAASAEVTSLTPASHRPCRHRLRADGKFRHFRAASANPCI